MTHPDLGTREGRRHAVPAVTTSRVRRPAHSHPLSYYEGDLFVAAGK